VMAGAKRMPMERVIACGELQVDRLQVTGSFIFINRKS